MNSWLATTALACMTSATALAQPAPPTAPPTVLVPDIAPALPAPTRAPNGIPRALPSARLLQPRATSGLFSIPYEVQQGPYTFQGSQLEMAVAGSPEALGLAREANAKFGEGSAFLIGGTVASLVGIGTLVASIATFPKNSFDDATASTVLIGTTLGLVVVALALDIAGASLATDGVRKWFEAVNTYNRQLIDGQIQTLVPSG
jgi:hypothetical protein